MILFLQEAPKGAPGAGRNCDRKVELIRSLGHRVVQISLSSRDSRLHGGPSFVQALVLILLRRPTVYARFSARPAPVAAVAAALGLRVVLEVNGEILSDIGNRWLRVFIKRVCDFLIFSPRVVICGDLGHRRYYTTLWPNVRWKPLPLGVDNRPEISLQGSSLAPERPWGFLFTGSFNRQQGISHMLAAYAELRKCRAVPPFRFYGGGPLEGEIAALDESGVSTNGSVPASEVSRLLEGGEVLVAAGPANAEGGPISMLKVADYLQSSRPIVAPSGDSLVVEGGFAAQDGVFVWDGRSVEGLAKAMSLALDAAQSGACYPERAAQVQRLRGPERQREALRDLLQHPIPEHEFGNP